MPAKKTADKAKSDKQKSVTGDIMEQAKAMLAFNPMMGPQVEQFWKMQENVLQDAEAFSRGWFERRHEAAQSALDATREVAGNGATEPTSAQRASAQRAVTDWNRHSLERMTEDFQEWMKFCTKCAGHFSKAELQAGEQEMEEVKKATAAAEKSKHSTPV